MSGDDTNRLNELVRTFARREAEIVLKNAQNAFTGEMASRLIDSVGAMSLKVAAMDTKLGVVGFQVDNLQHTLLGNGQPGKCKGHSDDISALRSFMDGIQAQVRVFSRVSNAALGLSGLVLTAAIFLYGVMHRDSVSTEAFHTSVQAEQKLSSERQTTMQNSLNTAGKEAGVAKAQRDAIQRTQADGPTVIIREFIRDKPKH